MDTTNRLKRILRNVLQIGSRADELTPESGLLGAIAEFDSMAVVSVMAMIEDEFDVTIADDEVSAENFSTLGSLADFVSGKSSV